MGNLALFTGLCRSDATMSEQVNQARFITNRISEGITYYYTPFLVAEEQTVFAAEDSQTSTALCPNSSPSPSALPVSDSSSADPSSSPLLSDSPSRTPASSQNQSDSSSTSRPLLLFFSWLGARPAAVGKYRDLYLDRGMDVLLVQSKVMHFLWPRWGLDYGMEVLKVLEQPQFSERAVLVHASSIGGFTFTQTLINVAQGRKQHAGLDQRVIGHIYDSLVVGTLEHMAIGLGKTLVPRLESFVKNAAMLYFWLFKKHTADIYDNSIQAFYDSPITAPALFFFSENDAMCDTADMEKLIDHWRMRGVTVESRKWKVSKHAAHMRCHPEDYLSTLEKYLKSLAISSSRANVRGLNA
ncbi:transmembrane protein 53-like isoform X1 [Anarrhichthys ocellatus]|uniref:transmembrane protein 53-like isoform X1 n=1 Tax=Anarrhichthys ocellatus TaxID=433405 RepID=UPI0012EE33E3|nr:transmembrane protein 53-like isoform X1 [Anarrhichthys ocellatus]